MKITANDWTNLLNKNAMLENEKGRLLDAIDDALINLTKAADSNDLDDIQETQAMDLIRATITILSNASDQQLRSR